MQVCVLHVTLTFTQCSLICLKPATYLATFPDVCRRTGPTNITSSHGFGTIPLIKDEAEMVVKCRAFIADSSMIKKNEWPSLKETCERPLCSAATRTAGLKPPQ
ncbi:hypothetical protein AOLI_G00055210 [Acnodon oligacanthus]